MKLKWFTPLLVCILLLLPFAACAPQEQPAGVGIWSINASWSGGNLYYKDNSGNTICYWDGTNRCTVIPDGSYLLADNITVSGGSFICDNITATYLNNITIPSGTVVGTTDVQTLTNKTLTTPVIASLFQNAGKTYLVTMPAGSCTVVGDNMTQTLTNKTLTSPKLNEDVTLSATATQLNAWAAKSAPSGTVVGTSDNQTLTVKYINSPRINDEAACTATSTQINALAAKSFPSGDIVGTSDNQTLTVKYINNPRINDEAACTATSTQINALAAKSFPSGDIVGTSDNQTLTVKYINNPRINDEAECTATSTQLNALTTDVIAYKIGDNGSTIWAGVQGDFEVPFACTITRATMFLSASDNITVSIWKDTYANYPPTATDNITADAQLKIQEGVKYQDSTLTGWTKTVAAGDVLRFNVDAAPTAATRCDIFLRITR